jgi:glutamyl-Q tRNA(Asp) synthetase
VVYQSQRLARYAETVETLLRAGRAFRCSCTRGSIQATHPASTRRYPGTCRERTHHARATAVRVRVDGGEQTFVDELQGRVSTRLERTTGDYVIWRRDGLPAYHLAVVLDDAAEGVTTVVRGIDLLESTAVHVHLQRLLDVGTPRYLHIPVVVNARGQKLSKQTGAEPIDRRAASETAWSALSLLGATMPADLRGERPATLWQWASDNWRIDRLRGCRAVCPAELGDAAKVD